jgi:hypothetical protein
VSQSDAFALGHSELNRFLFADVGVESNGMMLSVLSTLARLGHDPWQQAGQLAALPKAVAVDTLARIIATVPSSPWSLPDANGIATRLVALLPKHQDLPAAPPAKLALNGFQMFWSRAVLLTLLAAAVGTTVLSLGGEQEAILQGNALSTGASEPPASP